MTTAEEPAISVVVPTYQRAGRLARLVAALEAQEGVDSFEVVVVDDGSTDGTWDALTRLAATSRVPVVPMRLTVNRGPAAARNAGWRVARAPLVACTDDDCVPQPGWLAALVRGLAGADMVQGPTRPDPDQQAATGPFAHTVEVRGEGGFYETCNVGYRRDWLERLGGFDEGYRHPYGEDVDLAWRAREAGARTAFVADAVVLHDVAPSRFTERLRQARRLEGAVRVVRAHPGLRRSLVVGVFTRRAHPPALLAAAGLVAAATATAFSWRRRAAIMAVVGTPYLWHRLRVEPLPGPIPTRQLAVPLALVLDLAEMVVLARASLRYRTLVL